MCSIATFAERKTDGLHLFSWSFLTSGPTGPSYSRQTYKFPFHLIFYYHFSRTINFSSMDSTPVNWEALDSLIIDFVKSENLIEDSVSPSTSPSTSPSPSSSTSSSSSSSYQSRLLIRQIRRSVEFGDIDAAIDLLRVHAPFVLDDHRLLFCLQKQVTRCFLQVKWIRQELSIIIISLFTNSI